MWGYVCPLYLLVVCVCLSVCLRACYESFGKWDLYVRIHIYILVFTSVILGKIYALLLGFGICVGANAELQIPLI